MLLTTLPVRNQRVSNFDRTFAHLAGLALGADRYVRPASPNVHAEWKDGNYQLTVDVPGVPEEALSVSVTGRTLVIDVATDDRTWSQRIRVPQTLEVETTTANYANGRLTIVVPSAPEAQPRKVEITVGSPAVAQLDSAVDQPAETAANDTE